MRSWQIFNPGKSYKLSIIVPKKNIRFNARLLTTNTPSAIGPTLNYFVSIYSGAPRAKRACGAPWVNKSTHPRKFGNHVTDRPSAPQAYQCLLSHFLATLAAQEKADCTSMLLSIDSCQNKVSADQYHLAVSRAQVSTHRDRVGFEVIR